ncbi:hypothetical protein SAMN04489712_105155 [Thermomonospora echinospora]|uniref:Secreted protein n=1 Tax=Thermomonospora echinospora TaxID=1992 RepID=A0A1H6A1S5_9ACTN|nr:hypothetical protein [Thermomonospora echinospora]SEG42713.1 hypothetical protein SAMN04489712_105155 [Thermomonospora echinospora]
MSRRRIIVLTGAAAAIAAVTVVGFAATGQADNDPEPQDPTQSVVHHQVQQDPQEVEEYWTEERMRNAKPVQMPAPDAE